MLRGLRSRVEAALDAVDDALNCWGDDPAAPAPADPADRRECGFLGCGGARCEPLCAGVARPRALGVESPV